jgi:hypothetical protein
MGIYYDGTIYGICWNIYDVEGNFIRRFEKTSQDIITTIEIMEIMEEYKKLTQMEKSVAKFRFYKSCESNYEGVGKNSFMCWFPVDKKFIETFFNNYR